MLDAAGFPVIFVETVGAGQAEIDVADAADAVIVVTAPGLGDEVQALKAGLLEIADVLVVNKGDRDGADRAMADLTTMLELAAHPSRPGRAAARRAGVDSRVGGDGRRRRRHRGGARRAAGRAGGERAARRRRQAVRQITALVGEQARAAARAAIGTEGAPGPLASTVDQVAARTLDPWSAAEALATARGEVILWNHAQTTSFASLLALGVSVGCDRLISSDVTEITFDLPPRMYSFDPSTFNVPAGIAGEVPCGAAPVVDCCDPTPPCRRRLLADAARLRAERERDERLHGDGDRLAEPDDEPRAGGPAAVAATPVSSTSRSSASATRSPPTR